MIFKISFSRYCLESNDFAIETFGIIYLPLAVKVVLSQERCGLVARFAVARLARVPPNYVGASLNFTVARQYYTPTITPYLQKVTVSISANP